MPQQKVLCADDLYYITRLQRTCQHLFKLFLIFLKELPDFFHQRAISLVEEVDQYIKHAIDFFP